MAPIGRTIDLPGAVFARLDDDGFVVDERRYYDVASMIAQRGLVAAEYASTPTSSAGV